MNDPRLDEDFCQRHRCDHCGHVGTFFFTFNRGSAQKPRAECEECERDVFYDEPYVEYVP